MSHIFGRQRELDAIEDLLGSLDQRGDAVFISGEAGIGKTFLADTARQRADERGMRILAAVGVESEARLPLAGLHQMLRPLLGALSGLPAPQRTALEVAFGLSEGEQPDLFLTALAALTLISESAHERPVVLVAEDAQWLDEATADVLVFVARRVKSDPIAMLVTARTGSGTPFEAAELTRIDLSTLDSAAARELLDDRWPDLADEVGDRVIVAAAGNPLALVELPRALDDEQLTGTGRVPDRLPLTDVLERTFLLRYDALPPSTQSIVVAAALNDGEDAIEALMVAEQLTGEPQPLERLSPALRCELIDLEQGQLRFRHPLVRSAISQATAGDRRRVVHAALAEVVTASPDRRAWHLAAAALGLDEQVAVLLVSAAERAVQRGGLIDGIAAFERAAELTPDPATRGNRYLSASALALEAGRVDLAQRLRTMAEHLPLRRSDYGRATWLREATAPDVKGGPIAAQQTVNLARQVAADGEVDVALRILSTGAWNAFVQDSAAASADLFLSACNEMVLADDDPRVLNIRADVAPIRYGPQVIALATRRTATATDDPQALWDLVNALGALGAQVLADEEFRRGVESLRAHGRLRLLTHFLVLGGWAGWLLGRWDSAEADARESIHLAVDTRQPPIWNGAAHALLAALAGGRGHFDESDQFSALAEHAAVELGAPTLHFLTQMSRGVNALSAGRHDEAYHQLRRMFDPADPTHHSFWCSFAIGELAEAALGTSAGAEEESRHLLETIAEPLTASGAPWLLVSVRHARALLADDDVADVRYREGLDADLRLWPFHRARLHLAYGMWLRRRRQTAASRSPLRIARDTFDALGATPWSERARAELRAAGERSRSRVGHARDSLTPQELQIAQHAAAGLTNREIGHRLFLSHRTIATHLYRIYPKLGVTSRQALRDALESSRAEPPKA